VSGGDVNPPLIDPRCRGYAATPNSDESDWPEFIAAIVTDAGNREERIVQIRKRLNGILLNV